MEKTFKTIDEQIEILKSRNILISNYAMTHKILSKHNYYYLINGYKDLFLDNTSQIEKYINNTKFEEIYSLYCFDKNIKIVFLKYLLLIENELNTYISYEFSKSYGYKNYLILENFHNSTFNNSIIQKLINDINLEIQYQYKSCNPMITHYLESYSYIPLWVLVRILSFGKISKFYSLMKQREQNAVSRKYNLKTQEFKVILHNLTLVRNICAHDEKLYDIKMKNRLASTIYHKKLGIKSKNKNYQYATRDLFSVVISLKLLLSKKDFNCFYKKLLKNMLYLEKSICTIDFKNILDKMGFPLNYKELLYL